MSYGHFSNECDEHWPDLFTLHHGIGDLATRLNDHNGLEQGEMSMQMLKLAEEVGEVARAWIGIHGQNPTKGYTHTLEDVIDELADVAITAMVGISRLGPHPVAAIATKIREIRARYEAVDRA